MEAWGYSWIARSDRANVLYASANVSRYSQSTPTTAKGLPLFPSTRRIGISSPNNGTSGGIMLRDILGFGTYEVLIGCRMDALDPSLVAAVWTRDDDQPGTGVELDYEFGPWKDQNRTCDRLQLGVFVGAERKGLPQVLYGAPSYVWHRITLRQMPDVCQVKAEGWWELNQTWKDYAWGEWKVATPRPTRLKVGLLRFGADLVPSTFNGPPKLVVAGFRYIP